MRARIEAETIHDERTATLRASSGAFGLFAARRRADHSEAGEPCRRRAHAALALTDTNNLFGALEFSEYAAQAKIQPIIGCTLSLSFAAEPEARPDSGELVKHINHGRIALLAKDASGYANLIKLSTEAYRYGADSGEALVTDRSPGAPPGGAHRADRRP